LSHGQDAWCVHGDLMHGIVELIFPESVMSAHSIDIAPLLARLPLFQELTPEQLAEVVTTCRERRLSKGEMLFQKGDMAKGFYMVVFGQMKLAFPSAQGNEKVVEIVGPRQSFGEAVMFMDRPYPVFAEALLDSLLLHIPSVSVFELLTRDPLFARRLLAGLSMRLHALVQDVESYSQRSSAQRVIGYLLQHCPQGEKSEGALEISLPTTKNVIASRLNLTPETLSRIFHDLSEHKLISVQGKQITIHDMRRLREFDL
jgi:CRP-like cAMP-binding protein